MGIYNFWNYFKNTFSGAVHKLKEKDKFIFEIDNFMIDMNGLIHTSSQKIYKYGSYKPKTETSVIIPNLKNQIEVFDDVCKNIEILFNLVNPKKRLILAIDGSAPFSKIIQQRKRRYSASLSRNENDLSFDSSNISPGTQFMDYLGKYIDWFIKNKISENKSWQNIEVILSNSNAPNEGEAKLISYIRRYGNKDESYCIHALDADLLMLALGTHLKNIYVLRDDLYDYNNKYFIVNISNVALQLAEMVRWDSNKQYDPQNAVDDFIFLCFTMGNDFLPHIPSLEILEGGIDLILNIYKEIGKLHGHLLQNTDGDVMFNKNILKILFEQVSSYEKNILENKLKIKRYFQDKILENCVDDTGTLDIEKYRTEYCEEYFGKGKRKLKKISHDYLDGLQWVMKYYKNGCQDWKWHYAYDYAPPANIISENLDSYVCPKYGKTMPLTPYQQLLAIIPPKSKNLLPFPLNNLLTDDKSPLKNYCPEKFEIDLSGKKYEYQGVVLLPMINPELIINSYISVANLIDQKETKRNVFQKTLIYTYDINRNIEFRSYYGNIKNCKVKISQIIL